MALSNTPTKSESTLKAYPDRTRLLVNMCRKQTGALAHQQLDPRTFVGWLMQYRSSISRATWRQYKAATVHLLESEIKETDDPISKEALARLSLADSRGCKLKTNKTSGMKQKKMPLKDLYRIIKHLDDNPTAWGDPLTDWLIAGILTGLRPVEWGGSVIKNVAGEPALIVNNAKSTNQRSHGDKRTLLLGGLSDDEKESIKKHVDRATMWFNSGEYERYKRGCSSTLAGVSRKIWPNRAKHATLYSLRHQFTADAKASGYTRAEIAALMGHAVDRTATCHYGKRVSGGQMVRVRPSQDEVAKIRATYKNKFTEPTPRVAPTKKKKLEPQHPQES